MEKLFFYACFQLDRQYCSVRRLVAYPMLYIV